MNTTLPSRNVLMGIVRIALIFLFATQFFSCTDEQTQTPTPNGEEKMITFSVKVPGGFTPATYALLENDENAITTVDVLLFDKSNGNYISGPHYGSIEKDPEDDSKADVTIRIPENASNYDMVVLSNCRSDINGKDFSGDDKATALAKLIWSVKADKENSNWLETDGNKTIPMWGEYSSGTVSLTRMLARVNVTNNASSSFALSSVHLCNYNDAGYIAPTATIAAPNQTGISNAILYSGGTVISNNKCINEIYTFEAATAAAYDVNNPCLVIGGTYNGETYYYRVDFVKKTTDAGVDTYTYLDLLRNHKYEVNIETISGPGYTSAEDALKSRPINVVYAVEEWDDSSMADVVYNGQYKIATSASQFSFDAAGKTKDNGDNILFIETNHPDGWEATIDGASWLSLQDMDGNTTVTSSKNLQGVNAFSSTKASPVKMILQPNITNASRTAIIKLKAGNVYYSVKVTQSNQPNVYDVFMPESDTYTLFTSVYGEKVFIPVSIANASEIKLNSGDAFTAKVTSGSGIKKVAPLGVGSDGHVYVETDATAGDAIVSIYKQGDEVTPIYEWTIKVIEPTDETREANSYIVKPNSGILLPVSQANKTDGGTVLGTQLTGEAFTAELLWTDNVLAISPLSNIRTVAASGTGSTGKVLVGTGSGEGNAVIAIRKTDGNGKPTGEILWSWHIWVTDYEPVDAGGGFMDRNLGAFNNGNPQEGTPWSAVDAGTAGLLYQWGRKDPFPGTQIYTSTSGREPYIYYGEAAAARGTLTTPPGMINQIAITDPQGTQSIAYSIQNPDVFVRVSSGEWCSTDDGGATSNRWGYDPIAKTVYDPCPPGWRVPVIAQWSETKASTVEDPGIGSTIWLDTVTGYAQRNDAYGGVYPAAGIRNVTGSFTYVGTIGFNWSASPNSAIDSNRLRFTSIHVNTSVGGRAYGFAIRCIQE